ncbi:MAG: hypothetical protein VB092_08265, partial [Oscillospiraceae bacterium]|nr:hypothetical protein [Oscillospiraceae bacterium]
MDAAELLKRLKKEKPRSAGAQAGRRDRMVFITVASLLAAVIAVGFMFSGLISNYRTSTLQESAAHLTELNGELKLYVEARISSDWNATHSIVNSVAGANLGPDEALLTYLSREQDIWDVSNITLYMQSGYTVSTDGRVLANDVASETVADARASGEYLTIQESTLIYVVPVDTETTYHGSLIAVVSVAHDLSSFLDSMNISSFGGSAFLYLTQRSGAVVSELTTD